MTQEELAAGLTSTAQLSKIENGRTYVNRTLLKQIAQRLNVAIERLESVDGLQDELSEKLQHAKEALSVGEHDKCLEWLRDVNERSRKFGYTSILVEGMLVESRVLYEIKDYEGSIGLLRSALDN